MSRGSAYVQYNVMPRLASIKKRSVDRVVVGPDPLKRETVFLAVTHGLLHQRREYNRRLLAKINLVYDSLIVAVNLVTIVGKVLLIAVDELKQSQQGGEIVVVMVDTVERRLELYAKLRDGEKDHRRLIELVILGQFV
jgi:hypothetical protein